MKVKKLPNILAVHLKRFKYQEQLGRFSKLSNRVCFTEKLGLFNTAHEAESSERIYELCAIIVHIGSGPHHGHYVAVVKSHNKWLLLDDEDVTPLDDTDLYQYFGEANLGTGYLFIYNSQDFSSEAILKSMTPEGWQRPKRAQTPQPEDTLLGEPQPKPILASQELLDDENDIAQSKPKVTPDVLPSSPGSRTPRLRPRVDVRRVMNGQKPQIPILDAKRPSLPAINTAPAASPLSPGPVTATVVENPDHGKDSSGWNWFKNSKASKNK